MVQKKGNKIMETINHEYYVSSEVAKLLEKAGFDWKCRKCYNKGVLFDMEPDEIRTQTPQHSSYDVLAPTLDVAQRWLREVKGIEVYAHVFYDSREMLDELDVYVYEVNHITKHIEDYISSYDIYHTYEEAQESGIKKVLEIILEKVE